MFAVSVLMIVPLKAGTAVGSHSLTVSLSSVGLLLSVNTAYLAFIVLLLFFVICVSVNPEMVATPRSSLWFPPDRRPSGTLSVLRPTWTHRRFAFWTRGSRVSPPGPDGLRDCGSSGDGRELTLVVVAKVTPPRRWREDKPAGSFRRIEFLL